MLPTWTWTWAVAVGVVLSGSSASPADDERAGPQSRAPLSQEQGIQPHLRQPSGALAGLDASGQDARFERRPRPVVSVAAAGSNGRNAEVSVVVGYISGSVADAASGAPLANVYVEIYDSSGQYAAYGVTSASGTYASTGIVAGTYYAETYNQQGYLDELYDNLACALQVCTVTGGTPITVMPGATTTGIHFGLSAGGRIGGTVTDVATSLPLANGPVEIYDSAGAPATYGQTDGAGVYASGSGLPSGTYYARTAGVPGYVDELYNDIPCPAGACTVTSGTPISVTTGVTTAGVDFGLTPGGRIRGTVTDVATGLPLANVPIVVYDSTGLYVTDGATDATGVYTITGLLNSGSYYARTSNWLGYIDKLYDDIPCPAGACTVTSGTPIGVTVGATTAGVNFALWRSGQITGTVTAAATGQPLAGVQVYLSTSSGGYLNPVWTDSSGVYVFSGLVVSGNYYARTSNWQGFIDQLYDGIPCADGCTVTSGTPIAVTVGATTRGIDFRLAPGGRISGTVRDSVTHQPLYGLFVDIFDSTGAWVTDGYTNPSGAYVSERALLSGTYYAQTGNSDYFYELYDDIPCPDLACVVTTGTPISVTTGVTTAGVNFDLTPGGRVAGVVRDAATGQPLAGVEIRIYDSAGTWAAVGITGGSGAYTTSVGLVSGTYYARTANSLGYTDELYKDIACPYGACTVTKGKPIGVTVGATTAGIDFGLSRPTGFYTLTPCRVADTRNPISAWGGPALAANSTRIFPVTGLCDVPPSATAVAINVTVVGATDQGNLRLYAAGGSAPTSSSINFSVGQTRANNAIVTLGTDGQIAVRCDMPAGSTGHTDFVFDVVGYFQ